MMPAKTTFAQLAGKTIDIEKKMISRSSLNKYDAWLAIPVFSLACTWQEIVNDCLHHPDRSYSPLFLMTYQIFSRHHN